MDTFAQFHYKNSTIQAGVAATEAATAKR